MPESGSEIMINYDENRIDGQGQNCGHKNGELLPLEFKKNDKKNFTNSKETTIIRTATDSNIICWHNELQQGNFN